MTHRPVSTRWSSGRSQQHGGSALYELIYRVVSRVPRGRVATYGQVAELAGLPRQARLVGYALHALGEETAVPWQRVINARGEVSRRAESGAEEVQRCLLEAEGIVFDDHGRVDLTRYRWHPSGNAWTGSTTGGRSIERHDDGSSGDRL